MLNEDILDQFSHLLNEVHDCDPFTFTLASVDDCGRPTQRIISLLEVDLKGLVFFSNNKSRKGRHFAQRPRASACFYWHSLRQQVTFEGNIEVIEKAAALVYWNNRERANQIASWASRQSEPLETRQQLLEKVEQIKIKYRDKLIPPAPDWCAYRLIPDRVEFWKSGWQRLHDRVCFELTDEVWATSLLYP